MATDSGIESGKRFFNRSLNGNKVEESVEFTLTAGGGGTGYFKTGLHWIEGVEFVNYDTDDATLTLAPNSDNSTINQGTDGDGNEWGGWLFFDNGTAEKTYVVTVRGW